MPRSGFDSTTRTGVAIARRAAMRSSNVGWVRSHLNQGAPREAKRSQSSPCRRQIRARASANGATSPVNSTALASARSSRRRESERISTSLTNGAASSSMGSGAGVAPAAQNSGMRTSRSSTPAKAMPRVRLAAAVARIDVHFSPHLHILLSKQHGSGQRHRPAPAIGPCIGTQHFFWLRPAPASRFRRRARKAHCRCRCHVGALPFRALQGESDLLTHVPLPLHGSMAPSGRSAQKVAARLHQVAGSGPVGGPGYPGGRFDQERSTQLYPPWAANRLQAVS